MFPRIDQLRDRLACPGCRTPFERTAWASGCARCVACDRTVQLRDGQFRSGGFAAQVAQSDWLNRTKDVVKRRFGRLYPLAIELLSPVHTGRFVQDFLAQWDLDRQWVADFGCGTSRYDPRVVCVDGMDYDNVHVVCDLDQTPLQTAALDAIVSVAVLEHVADPAAHVAEMHRVLRPGGRVLCFVPFIQGFHASPHDFQRLTESGLRHLFKEFDVLAVRVGSGPTSALLWVVQEWLAMLLSFGSLRLYRMVMPLMWILSPIKYLDLLMARHPAASTIACGLVIDARKP